MHSDHHLHVWTGIYLFAGLIPLTLGWGWTAIITIGIARLVQQTVSPSGHK